MAQGVAERAKTASGTNVVLKRVGEVTADDLLSSDAVIAGSTVYFVHTAGGVKTFFDNWFLKFDFFRELKCEIKLVVRFNRWMISNGKEITMMAILEAMLISKMIITSAGGHSDSAQAQQPDRTRPALTKGNLYCCC